VNYTIQSSNLTKIKKRKNKETKYIQCDNSGENIKLQEEIETGGHNIVFEFTAPNTPQQMVLRKGHLLHYMEESKPCFAQVVSNKI
jgi:hypothetical protein